MGIEKSSQKLSSKLYIVMLCVLGFDCEYEEKKVLGVLKRRIMIFYFIL